MQGITSKAWILVCDGKRAIYLENKGSALHPNLEVHQVHEHDDPASHDINSDAPGRTSGPDGRRSSVDNGDAHDLQEQRFLKAIGERMEKFHAKFHFQDFILVAPARALGLLRKVLPHQLKSILRAELEKDLVKLSVPEITHHLMDAFKIPA